MKVYAGVSNFDLFPKDFQSNLRHNSNAIKLKLPSLIIVVQRFRVPNKYFWNIKKLPERWNTNTWSIFLKKRFWQPKRFMKKIKQSLFHFSKLWRIMNDEILNVPILICLDYSIDIFFYSAGSLLLRLQMNSTNSLNKLRKLLI